MGASVLANTQATAGPTAEDDDSNEGKDGDEMRQRPAASLAGFGQRPSPVAVGGRKRSTMATGKWHSAVKSVAASSRLGRLCEHKQDARNLEEIITAINGKTPNFFAGMAKSSMLAVARGLQVGGRTSRCAMRVTRTDGR